MVIVVLVVVVSRLLDYHDTVLLSLKDLKNDALLLLECFDDIEKFEFV